MIAGQQGDPDPLAGTPERVEDPRELPDQDGQLVVAVRRRELPEPKRIADDHQLDVFVLLGGQFPEEEDELVLEVADAQGLVSADVQVADEVVRSQRNPLGGLGSRALESTPRAGFPNQGGLSLGLGWTRGGGRILGGGVRRRLARTPPPCPAVGTLRGLYGTRSTGHRTASIAVDVSFPPAPFRGAGQAGRKLVG